MSGTTEFILSNLEVVFTVERVYMVVSDVWALAPPLARVVDGVCSHAPWRPKQCAGPHGFSAEGLSNMLYLCWWLLAVLVCLASWKAPRYKALKLGRWTFYLTCVALISDELVGSLVAVLSVLLHKSSKWQVLLLGCTSIALYLGAPAWTTLLWRYAVLQSARYEPLVVPESLRQALNARVHQFKRQKSAMIDNDRWYGTYRVDEYIQVFDDFYAIQAKYGKGDREEMQEWEENEEEEENRLIEYMVSEMIYEGISVRDGADLYARHGAYINKAQQRAGRRSRPESAVDFDVDKALNTVRGTPKFYAKFLNAYKRALTDVKDKQNAELATVTPESDSSEGLFSVMEKDMRRGRKATAWAAVLGVGLKTIPSADHASSFFCYAYNNVLNEFHPQAVYDVESVDEINALICEIREWDLRDGVSMQQLLAMLEEKLTESNCDYDRKFTAPVGAATTPYFGSWSPLYAIFGAQPVVTPEQSTGAIEEANHAVTLLVTFKDGAVARGSGTVCSSPEMTGKMVVTTCHNFQRKAKTANTTPAEFAEHLNAVATVKVLSLGCTVSVKPANIRLLENSGQVLCYFAYSGPVEAIAEMRRPKPGMPLILQGKKRSEGYLEHYSWVGGVNLGVSAYSSQAGDSGCPVITEHQGKFSLVGIHECALDRITRKNGFVPIDVNKWPLGAMAIALRGDFAEEDLEIRKERVVPQTPGPERDLERGAIAHATVQTNNVVADVTSQTETRVAVSVAQQVDEAQIGADSARVEACAESESANTLQMQLATVLLAITALTERCSAVATTPESEVAMQVVANIAKKKKKSSKGHKVTQSAVLPSNRTFVAPSLDAGERGIAALNTVRPEPTPLFAANFDKCAVQYKTSRYALTGIERKELFAYDKQSFFRRFFKPELDSMNQDADTGAVMDPRFVEVRGSLRTVRASVGDDKLFALWQAWPSVALEHESVAVSMKKDAYTDEKIEAETYRNVQSVSVFLQLSQRLWCAGFAEFVKALPGCKMVHDATTADGWAKVMPTSYASRAAAGKELHSVSSDFRHYETTTTSTCWRKVYHEFCEAPEEYKRQMFEVTVGAQFRLGNKTFARSVEQRGGNVSGNWLTSSINNVRTYVHIVSFKESTGDTSPVESSHSYCGDDVLFILPGRESAAWELWRDYCAVQGVEVKVEDGGPITGDKKNCYMVAPFLSCRTYYGALPDHGVVSTRANVPRTNAKVNALFAKVGNIPTPEFRQSLIGSLKANAPAFCMMALRPELLDPPGLDRPNFLALQKLAIEAGKLGVSETGASYLGMTEQQFVEYVQKSRRSPM